MINIQHNVIQNRKLLERHQIIIHDYFNGYSDSEYIIIIKE